MGCWKSRHPVANPSLDLLQDGDDLALFGLDECNQSVDFSLRKFLAEFWHHLAAIGDGCLEYSGILVHVLERRADLNVPQA